MIAVEVQAEQIEKIATAIEASQEQGRDMLRELRTTMVEHLGMVERMGGKDAKKGMNYWNGKAETLRFVIQQIDALGEDSKS